MRSFWVRAIAVVLLLMVAYLLISPAFDLDPSANRAWRSAKMVLLSIALIALAISDILAVSPVLFVIEELAARPPSAPSLDLLCLNRC